MKNINIITLILSILIFHPDIMAQKKITQTAGRDQLGDFAPEFAHLNDDILFGEVWSRNDLLSLRDRSLITVTALISQGITDSSLIHHMQTAKNNGITRLEISEVITHIAFYAGWPKALGGRGWYQEEGKSAIEILPGTVIHIPANVKHWHGAAADSWFSHLAFGVPGEDISTEWLEPIDDSTYEKINQ